MKKVKIMFFTSNIIVNGDSSSQDSFSIHCGVDEKTTNLEIAQEIVDDLADGGFIGNDEGTHFYRKSTITDFIIKEIKEENK